MADRRSTRGSGTRATPTLGCDLAEAYLSTVTCAPVRMLSSVVLPTLGKPRRPTFTRAPPPEALAGGAFYQWSPRIGGCILEAARGRRRPMRPPVQLVLAAAFLAAIAVAPAGAAQARTHTVDYVIGMLEAGVDQPTILARIHDARLTFQIAAGDLDRLRDAGAGDALVQAVKGAAAAPSDEKSAAPGASSRPQRLGQGAGEAGERLEATAPERESAPDEEMEPPDGSEAQQPEESEEAPHGGYPYYSPSEDWGYDGYYPPYYVYYGPPYYYYPYYPYSF